MCSLEKFLWKSFLLWRFVIAQFYLEASLLQFLVFSQFILFWWSFWHSCLPRFLSDPQGITTLVTCFSSAQFSLEKLLALMTLSLPWSLSELPFVAPPASCFSQLMFSLEKFLTLTLCYCPVLSWGMTSTISCFSSAQFSLEKFLALMSLSLPCSLSEPQGVTPPVSCTLCYVIFSVRVSSFGVFLVTFQNLKALLVLFLVFFPVVVNWRDLQPFVLCWKLKCLVFIKWRLQLVSLTPFGKMQHTCNILSCKENVPKVAPISSFFDVWHSGILLSLSLPHSCLPCQA